jgi:hypothetical protein
VLREERHEAVGDLLVADDLLEELEHDRVVELEIDDRITHDVGQRSPGGILTGQRS